MWEFVEFIRDGFFDIYVVLNHYNFNIIGMQVSIFDILIGLLATAFIISVFWKGARA